MRGLESRMDELNRFRFTPKTESVDDLPDEIGCPENSAQKAQEIFKEYLKKMPIKIADTIADMMIDMAKDGETSCEFRINKRYYDGVVIHLKYLGYDVKRSGELYGLTVIDILSENSKDIVAIHVSFDPEEED